MTGTVGLLVVLGLSFAAAFALAMAFLGSRDRELRERRVRELVHVGGPQASEQTDKEEETSWVRATAARFGGRVENKEGRAEALDLKLERAGWSLKPGEFAGIQVLSGVGGLVLGLILSGSLVVGFAVGGLSAALPSFMMRRASRKRAAGMQGQLADVLMILASSLRAGHSFLQALDSVAQEITEPAAQEFHRVVSEIRLGKPITEAMDDLATRVASEDFNWAVMAVNIQRDVGGNLAEVLDTVAETMRERERIRGQIQVLSAEGRLSIWILTALPFVVGTYMLLVRPEYIRLLWERQVGVVMLAVSAGLMGLGFLWMRKVVRIHV